MNTPETRLQYTTIVVVTEPAEPMPFALRYAQAIARLHHSALVIAEVGDPVHYASPAADQRACDTRACDTVEKIEEEAQRPGIPIPSVEDEAGAIYTRIVKAVFDHNADLLVLGTGAKTKMGRAALGMAARHLLTKVQCPLLAIPPDADAHLPCAGRWRRVLVATDFSSASFAALSFAHRIAHEQLIVLHAPPSTNEHERMLCLERLRFLAPLNESHTVPVEHIVASGDAAGLIVQHARRFHADLIVLGTPKIELTPEKFHSSTIWQVISEVSCPVLCVPPARNISSSKTQEEASCLC